MWWPFSFKKTRRTRSDTAIKHSFSNVKKDIMEIKDITEQNTKGIQQLNSKIEQIESSISDLNHNFSILTENKSVSLDDSFEKLKTPKTTKEASKRLWENLTNLQRSMLINLKLLLDEENKKWIPMKYLSQELYPDKSYTDVKAMISNYTDLLFEHGLLLKKRKGRDTYLTITEKTLPFIPKKEVKIKKRVENKN